MAGRFRDAGTAIGITAAGARDGLPLSIATLFDDDT
jgi:hypothetical protein